MVETLLRTKLHIPPVRSSLVHRDRLFRMLDAGMDRKLILVSAPAGFGKTVLVSDWIRQRDRRSAWLAIDERDNDPTRFLTYFIAALQTMQPEIGERALTSLRNQQSPPLDRVLVALIDGLSELSGPVLVVLDDYHLVQTEQVHDLLTYLLAHMPLSLRLVITSRADPPLPLPRLRIHAEMTELRAADLAFTSTETAAFFDQVTGIRLSNESLRVLERRTEGWVAGLQVAALSLHNRSSGEREAFLQNFAGSHRYILDYLAEEVFQQQSEAVRSFLLQTAILDRLCAPLCDALTERTGSHHILRALERTNLFLIPLDDDRVWFRYHHLFRDFLRTRLSSTGSYEQPLLHKRAAGWYQQQGMVYEVGNHLLSAGDFEAAADHIANNAIAMLVRGDSLTVDTWLNQFPADFVQNHPNVGLIRAWILLTNGRYQETEVLLPSLEKAVAEQTLAQADAGARGLKGMLAALQSTVSANLRRVPKIVAYSHRALELIPSEERQIRCIVQWNLAFARRLQGDLTAAEEMYTQAITNSLATENYLIAVQATTGLANVHRYRGDLKQAHRSYQDALAHVARKDASPYHAIDTYMYLAGLQYEWNRLDAAAATIQQGITLSREIGYEDSVAVFWGLSAMIQGARGQSEAAVETVEEAANLVKRHGFVRREKAIANIQARLYVAQGRYTSAGRLAENYQLPSILVRLHIATGRVDAALALLSQRRVDFPEQEGDLAHEIICLLLETQVHQRSGNDEMAKQMVKRALSLAAPGGYLRTFVDEGQWLIPHLRQPTVRDTTPEAVDRILSAFAESVRTEPAVQVMRKASEHVVPDTGRLPELLSRRELDTLRFLATALSVPEIAEEMVIAASTVRSHTKRIYRKLDVHNRRQAVRRARELGLIPER